MPELIERTEMTRLLCEMQRTPPAHIRSADIAPRFDALEEVLAALRALPAIGTCTTCAEWVSYLEDQSRGFCKSSAYHPPGEVQTWPHHSCAAHKPRQEGRP